MVEEPLALLLFDAAFLVAVPQILLPGTPGGQTPRNQHNAEGVNVRFDPILTRLKNLDG